MATALTFQLAPPAGGPPIEHAKSRSYRQLTRDLMVAEEALEHWETASQQAVSESKALRDNIAAAEERSDKRMGSSRELSARLALLRERSADLWTAHEAPLRNQQNAHHASTRAWVGLGAATAARRRTANALRDECQALAQLEASLSLEITEAAASHKELELQLEAAEVSAKALTSSCTSCEERVTTLGEEAAVETDHHNLLEAEAGASRQRAESVRRELGEMERRYRGSAINWWDMESAHCEALATEAGALKQELDHGRVALEGRARESALWRERAYRSELGLRALRREDVAGGLRALDAQCAAYVEEGLGSAPGVMRRSDVR
eukprot:gnl/TRDRNA2_/TRDRNA2_130856_c0_seq1.p1 gnl/TRDRNA2_/TRDRNA2_130856_c0~~gnl/TRDRNA2_/TRDRNA2_130856_c0_seq1.p1  ORF type:complete len:324 (+),score=57.79 gnl/TRDRNA2_/TRDRNA2_130856_c0_seq1:51-1022(+)